MSWWCHCVVYGCDVTCIRTTYHYDQNFYCFQKTRNLRDSRIKCSFWYMFWTVSENFQKIWKQYSLKTWTENLITKQLLCQVQHLYSRISSIFNYLWQFPVPLEVYNIVYSNCLASPSPPIGSVWSWGDGDFGKLGRGGSDSCKAPKLITNFNAEVAKVRCGSQFSIALTRDGRVFTWWEEMNEATHWLFCCTLKVEYYEFMSSMM